MALCRFLLCLFKPDRARIPANWPREEALSPTILKTGQPTLTMKLRPWTRESNSASCCVKTSSPQQKPCPPALDPRDPP